MIANDTVFLVLSGLGMSSGLIAIILIFYIGRTRIKKIDKAVYGYEFPHDSIFALLIRVPNYAGAFIWGWSAKRSGLEGKIEQFSKQFRWPFIISFFLFFFSMFCFVVAGFFMS